MENIYISATRTTPEISLDCEKHILEIRGESFPENTAAFYNPIMDWICAYMDRLESQNVTVNMEIVYFNSSSSKILMDFFDILAEASENGKSIVVNWIYDPENENALSTGEEFQEDFETLRLDLVRKDTAE